MFDGSMIKENSSKERGAVPLLQMQHWLFGILHASTFLWGESHIRLDVISI
jgi:hypothetical protein